jgi:hypothetical protein
MDNYQAVHSKLPPAVVYGKDGKALYSWRVLLLPFMEEKELHEQFKLDEPWNSAHNKPLLARMPAVYSPFNGEPPAEPHTTFYQVFVGKGTALDHSQGVHRENGSPVHSAMQFLIVEAGKAVPWTAPEDLAYAPDQPLPALGGISRNGFRAAFVDGHVSFFRKETTEATLRALITGEGTEKLDLNFYD